MAHWLANPASGRDVPQGDRVPPKHRKTPPLRAECRAGYCRLVRHAGTDRFAVRDIPELSIFIGDNDKPLPVVADDEPSGPVRNHDRRRNKISGRTIPSLDKHARRIRSAVLSSDCEREPPVGTETCLEEGQPD